MTGSIRWRLTIWYAGALTLALVLFGFLLWFSLQRTLISEIDGDLADRAARFQAYFVAESSERNAAQLTDELDEFCAALPPGSFIELTGSDGLTFRYPRSGSYEPASTRILRTSFPVAAAQFDLVEGESLLPVLHTTALLRFLLLSLTPLAIAFACIGGWLLSRGALKPVAEITDAAQAISIDNLSVRLNVPRTGDELERLAEVFNSMLQRLESAVGTLSQFVADASHELRTPLAVIRTGAEIALRRARSPEAYREALAGIAAETERMTVLVEDLLLLARSDSGHAAPRMAPEDLNGIAEEAIGSIEHLADARFVRVIFKRSAQPATILGNRPALRRLIIALLDNAVKNSPEHSHIEVQIRSAAEWAAIAVQDFGAGIDASDLPHIFKRFYRADKARSGQGYGLGLSIADSIAKAHGASISVKSAPGEGSTFEVRFRLAEGGAQQEFERNPGSKVSAA